MSSLLRPSIFMASKDGTPKVPDKRSSEPKRKAISNSLLAMKVLSALYLYDFAVHAKRTRCRAVFKVAATTVEGSV